MTEVKPTPNAEQSAYIAAVKDGRNTLLTGPGGSGKSFTLDCLRQAYPFSLSITATTGIGALNVKGMTIHSWAKLGLGRDTARHIAKNIVDKKDRVYDKMIACRRLAIDEVSMLSAPLLALLDDVLRIVRKTDSPFGGIQMLFIGDFLQLPPVPDKPIGGPEAEDTGLFGQTDKSEHRFAFQSDRWAEAAIQVHELKTIVRQTDVAFMRVLNKVRRGVVDNEVKECLNSRLNAVDRHPGIKPIKTNGYNKQVEAINQMELQKLQGKSYAFKAEDQGAPFFLEKIRKDCIAPELLTLKIGAQVMLLRNLNTEGGLVNGSLGIVRDVTSDNCPMVEFADGQEVKIEPKTWELSRDGEVLASRTQTPLRLAWAWTIHKSQGMTFDKAEVDLSSCFESGQAYVALSRLRTLDGLFLTGLNFNSIKADPDALKFYGY